MRRSPPKGEIINKKSTGEDNMNTKFEVGKTYATTSICDSNCIITGKVIKRTAATVTMDVRGRGVVTLRISKPLSMIYKCEAVKPWGGYAMSPTLTADRFVA